ncbi:MAG TPA: hypothetical protein VKP01_10855 [Saliniramus sp.]|nr:hypothetical protein [Saliniramus sp.]
MLLEILLHEIMPDEQIQRTARKTPAAERNGRAVATGFPALAEQDPIRVERIGPSPRPLRRQRL